MSPVQLTGGTAHDFCPIEQSHRKKWNFGGVTEVHHERRVAAWINAIVAPVDCFYFIPLAHTADAIVTLFWFLVVQCCGGSSTQTASMGHHQCNSLAPPHMLYFWLSQCKEVRRQSLAATSPWTTCCGIDRCHHRTGWLFLYHTPSAHRGCHRRTILIPCGAMLRRQVYWNRLHRTPPLQSAGDTAHFLFSSF